MNSFNRLYNTLYSNKTKTESNSSASKNTHTTNPVVARVNKYRKLQLKTTPSNSGVDDPSKYNGWKESTEDNYKEMKNRDNTRMDLENLISKRTHFKEKENLDYKKELAALQLQEQEEEKKQRDAYYKKYKEIKKPFAVAEVMEPIDVGRQNVVNLAVHAKDAIVDNTKKLASGAANLVSTAVNKVGNVGGKLKEFVSGRPAEQTRGRPKYRSQSKNAEEEKHKKAFAQDNREFFDELEFQINDEMLRQKYNNVDDETLKKIVLAKKLGNPYINVPHEDYKRFYSKDVKRDYKYANKIKNFQKQAATANTAEKKEKIKEKLIKFVKKQQEQQSDDEDFKSLNSFTTIQKPIKTLLPITQAEHVAIEMQKK